MPLPETLLIIVGDELLGGFTIDVNGALAARRLFEAGYPVRRIEVVGDSVDDIAAAVRRAIDDPRAARVIVSGASVRPPTIAPRGGRQGPGRDLAEDAAALRQIEAMVARMHAAGWSRARPHPCQPEDGPDGERRADPGQPQGYAPPLAILLEAAPAAGAEEVRAGGYSSSRVPREFQAVLEEVLIPGTSPAAAP